jgi:ribosomal-protein-alanine N-acetyltransferase
MIATFDALATVASPLADTSDRHEERWIGRLPDLTGPRARMRQLDPSDAPALLAMLTGEEMTRFISPPPATLEGFERFIAWTDRQRERGAYVGWGVTLKGNDTPIGLFQVRRLDRTFELAEWGFAIASPYWGTGLFEECARMALNFVFDALPVQRLEARAAVRNGRGNGALLKLGAVQEGILRQSLRRNGQLLDQVMYSILKADWEARSLVSAGNGVLVH